MIANANSIVQLAIQIKNGIMILVNASVKSIVSAKMVIVGILAHVFAEMANILKLLLIFQSLRLMKLNMFWILY